MFVHHIVTIILLCGSYACGYQRIGLLVQLIHDVSDIGVDLLKMFNYLKLEGTQGLFLSEIVYVGNLCSWMYWRLYIFPYYVIYSSAYESHVKLASHSKGDILANINPFELWSIYPDYPLLIAMNGALVLLFLLHWYWFFLFVRIGYKIITKGAHEAGAEEYEGASGSEKEDNRTE